ncbi:MAG TPA: hypothetical protein DCY07_04435 [Rhodospirillaceae bacterium]|nr:hypothetical protein [Rhodospirillaceae bacterium]
MKQNKPCLVEPNYKLEYHLYTLIGDHDLNKWKKTVGLIRKELVNNDNYSLMFLVRAIEVGDTKIIRFVSSTLLRDLNQHKTPKLFFETAKKRLESHFPSDTDHNQRKNLIPNSYASEFLYHFEKRIKLIDKKIGTMTPEDGQDRLEDVQNETAQTDKKLSVDPVHLDTINAVKSKPERLAGKIVEKKPLSPIEISNKLEGAWHTLQETDDNAVWEKIVTASKPFLAQNDIFALRFLETSITRKDDKPFALVSEALLSNVDQLKDPSYFEYLAVQRTNNIHLKIIDSDLRERITLINRSSDFLDSLRKQIMRRVKKISLNPAGPD